MSRIPGGWPCSAFLLLGACAAPPAPALPPAAGAAPAAHVVLIVVDGLRPDAIAAAQAPNLGKLVASGAASSSARAVEIPETLASFVTIVTGLAPSGHGVTWNDDRGITLGPTIYTRVAEAGLPAALYFGKSKLAALAEPGTAAVSLGPGPHDSNWPAGDGMALARAFARDFAARPFAFALVHLRQPDYVGHDAGWMSPAYLDAVRRDDAALGVILEASAVSPVGGRTTVLLTSDHGGEGTNHRAKGTDANWQIPWICGGPGVRTGAIAGTPSLLDVAPTVLALLGLAPMPDSQGRAVEECLVKTP